MKLNRLRNVNDNISKDPLALKIAMILMGIIVFLGTIWALSLLFKGLRAIWRHCFRPSFQSHERMYDLYGKYDSTGKKKISWAVVTGGSDGIGEAMCHNLAR